jgi:hypothetical protein
MLEKPEVIYRSNFRFSKLDSCVLNLNDLKKLCKMLEEKVGEAAEIEIREFRRPQDMDDEQFEKIKENIRQISKLSIQLFGIKGEQIAGDSLSVFDPDKIPDDIRSLNLNSSFTFRFSTNYDPKNRFEINLDFRKSEILDFSNPSFQPSPNNSSINIVGTNETWVNGVYHSFLSFLKSKKRKRNWLHSKYIYDLYLYLLIFPITFWSIFRVDKYLKLLKTDIPTVLSIAIYIYIFFIILFIFRLLFNYARWIFPLLEFAPDGGTKMGKHRTILSVIFLGVLVSLIWEILKFIF